MMKEKLLQDKELLKKQLFWIDISYEECKIIGIKEAYSIEEFGKFETLCSRYSRSILKYIEDELTEMFEEVLEYTSKLIDIIHNTLDYMDRYNEN